jgi:hypothetical protein
VTRCHVLVLVLVAACKAQEGEPCNLAEVDCLDQESALVCSSKEDVVSGASYRRVPCKGPEGCRDPAEVGGPEPITGVASCDVLPVEGDPCDSYYMTSPRCDPSSARWIFVCAVHPARDGGQADGAVVQEETWHGSLCANHCEPRDGGRASCR